MWQGVARVGVSLPALLPATAQTSRFRGKNSLKIIWGFPPGQDRLESAAVPPRPRHGLPPPPARAAGPGCGQAMVP